MGNTPFIIRVLGYPIRTSSDHSSVDNSPRPIAVSHVLHRLLMPRHPPCAHKHFTTTRCSHPLCNTQQTTTPHHTTTTTHTTQTPHRSPRRQALDDPRRRRPENTPNRCPLRTQQRAKPHTHPQAHAPFVFQVPPSRFPSPTAKKPRPTTCATEASSDVKGENSSSPTRGSSLERR